MRTPGGLAGQRQDPAGHLAENSLTDDEAADRFLADHPDRSWRLADWLDHWLENVVLPNRRLATCRLYEMTVRLYLKPGLGPIPLTRLSASRVQAFFNDHLRAGRSVRAVQVMRTVLSSALSRAMREELISRNVARLVELAAWERQPITPWSAAEARAFLSAAEKDPLYPAFMLLLVYGLRLGEVLGLRWHVVDEYDGEVRIRQQVQRVKGQLRLYPLQTAAGRRDLPLLPVGQRMLALRREAQSADRREQAGPGRTMG